MAPRKSGSGEKSRTQQFYDLQDTYRSPESYQQDLARGVLALGVSLFVLSFAFGKRTGAVLNLRNPHSKTAVVLVVALSWFSYFAAQEIWMKYCASRGDFPWWADTIIIPLVEFDVLAMATAPLVAVALIIALVGAQLPSEHGVFELKRVRFWLSSAVALPLVVLFTNECYVAIRDGAVPIVAACTLCLAGVYTWWRAAAVPRSHATAANDA